MSQLLNTYQAAELLDYHPQTIRDLARQGLIPAVKRRQKWFFETKKLLNWFHNGNTPTSDANEQISDL